MMIEVHFKDGDFCYAKILGTWVKAKIVGKVYYFEGVYRSFFIDRVEFERRSKNRENVRMYIVVKITTATHPDFKRGDMVEVHPHQVIARDRLHLRDGMYWAEPVEYNFEAVHDLEQHEIYRMH